MSDVGLAVWTIVCMVIGGMFTLIFLTVADSRRDDGPYSNFDEPRPFPPDEFDRVDWEKRVH
jgi:hypothetical protein